MVPEHVGASGESAESVLEKWHSIFSQFDRDGGGDVDLREIGLMFRHLGQKPSDAQMQLFVEEVDIDGSGTVDFEEFCLLMMRQQRLTRCPEWLYQMLHPPLFDESLPGELPTVATLNDGRHDAAQRIRRHLTKGRVERDSNEDASKKDSLGVRPVEFTSFTRELLLSIVDLLPSAEHIRHAQLSGHGTNFGPFMCQELFWRLVTSTRTTVEHVELANNNLGDDGAVAVSRAMMKMESLVSIDLSANGIGQRGATAIYEALKQMPDQARLTSIRLDDNREIPPVMQAAIAAQALANNLHTIVNEARQVPAPAVYVKPQGSEEPFGAGSHPLEQQVEGMPMPGWPVCTLREQWLSAVHMAALRSYLSHTAPKKPRIRALLLADCPHLTDGALAHLFSTPPAGTYNPAPNAPTTAQIEREANMDRVTQSVFSTPAPPPYAFMAHLQYLRVSKCACADLAANALADAAEGGYLPCLVGLALDRNQLTLADADKEGERERTPGGHQIRSYALASKFGAGLRCLPKLEQLDLCHNEKLSDDACAELVLTLLQEPFEDGGRHSPTGSPLGVRVAHKKGFHPAEAASRARAAPAAVRILHLGATGAGDATAAAVAHVLPTCSLEALCIGGDVGDKGTMALAAALPHSRSLRELWLGNRVGDTVGLPAIVEAMSSPNMPIKLLGLGGKVRGGVVLTNRLESRAPLLLAEALRANPDGVNELRLSGNARIGGAGIAILIGALKSCSALRELHVDGCGITAEHAKNIVEAMNEVWCLHVLVVEGSGGGSAVGEPKRGAWGRKGTNSKPVLSMQQRLSLARLLEENRRQGRRRVESWRLSRSLDEVAWVFTSLCADVDEEVVKGPLKRWDGAACAQLARNLGLPQYAESFAFNLTGAALPHLQMRHLAQLGVGAHDDQKSIMKAVRDLLHGYERREAVAKAQASWTLVLLGPRASPSNGDGDTIANVGGGVPAAPDSTTRNARDGRRAGRGRRQEMVAGEADVLTMPGATMVPTAPSQRPDPTVAVAISEASRARGSVASLHPRPHLPQMGSSLAGRVPSPRIVIANSGAQTARTARDTAGVGAQQLPRLMPGRGFATAGDDARLLLAAAEAVGQPTSVRDGAGGLPVNAWLARTPRENPAYDAQGGTARGKPTAPSARRVAGEGATHKVSRNEELSRRILASLSAGGKLPPSSRNGQRPAFFVDAKNEEQRARAQREAIIKIRLGVSDPV